MSTTSTVYIFRFAGTQYTFDGPGGTGVHTDVFDGAKHTLMVTWDNAAQEAKLFINNVQTDDPVTINTDTPTPITNDNLYIGGKVGDYACEGVIYNFKILNAPILPYGSYFTGNGASVDTDLAHDDILFYWDCETTTENIGGLTMTPNSTSLNDTRSITGTYSAYSSASNDRYTSGTITDGDMNEGSLSLWFYTTDSSSGRMSLIRLENSESDYIYITAYTSNNTIAFRRSGADFVMITPTDTWASGVWTHISMHWSVAQTDFWLMCNGVEAARWSTDAYGEVSTLSNTGVALQVGDDGFEMANPIWIDQLYITSSPSTPQIPTANGIPLHVPVIQAGS